MALPYIPATEEAYNLYWKVLNLIKRKLAVSGTALVNLNYSGNETEVIDFESVIRKLESCQVIKSNSYFSIEKYSRAVEAYIDESEFNAWYKAYASYKWSPLLTPIMKNVMGLTGVDSLSIESNKTSSLRLTNRNIYFGDDLILASKKSKIHDLICFIVENSPQGVTVKQMEDAINLRFIRSKFHIIHRKFKGKPVDLISFPLQGSSSKLYSIQVKD